MSLPLSSRVYSIRDEHMKLARRGRFIEDHSRFKASIEYRGAKLSQAYFVNQVHIP